MIFVFSSLNITDMAAEAGSLRAPQTLSSRTPFSTTFRKSTTTLGKENRLGQKMLSCVILTTLSDASALMRTLVVVT